jgi:hypothetical protein
MESPQRQVAADSQVIMFDDSKICRPKPKNIVVMDWLGLICALRRAIKQRNYPIDF